MGMIVNGKYYKESDIKKLQRSSNSTYKQHERNRQRKDFAREIIQPFDRTGKLSEDFKQAWPQEAENYGKSQT